MLYRAVTHPSEVTLENNYIVRWSGKSKHFETSSGPLSLKFSSSPKIEWRIKGRSFQLNPSTLLVLDQGEPYEVHVKSGVVVSAAGIFFSEELAAQLDESRPILPRIMTIRETNAELVNSLVVWPQSTEDDEYLLSEAIDIVRECFLAYEMQKELLELKREATSKDIMIGLYRARDLILSRSNLRLSLQDLAKEAGLSKYHFHRLFSTAFGHSCHAFLDATRLDRAMDLLTMGQVSVEDVALQCGFNSGRTLRLKFVRRFGMTPSTARATCKFARLNTQDSV